MNKIKKFGTIIVVSLCGEILHALLPLPIPASVYGLVLMLGLLVTGIVPFAKIEQTGKLFLEFMPILFIPPAVGIMADYAKLEKILLPVVVIVLTSTIVVMAVTGKTAQALVSKEYKKETEK